MPTVDRVLPWRRNERPAGGRGRPAAGGLPGSAPQGVHRAHRPGLPHLGGCPPRPVPPVGRDVHPPPPGRRPHRRRPRPRRRHRGGGAPARRRRGHRDHPGGPRGGLRGRRRRDRGRRHQARSDQVRHQGGPAGRLHAQDARGDGQGPAGPDHQALRPPPQHAHDRRHAGVEAGAHRPRDARHLRPPGPPPRHAGGAPGARGPVLRGHAPEALRRDRPHGVHPEPRARPLPHPGARAGAGAAGRAADQRRGHRAAEAPLLHLREDGREGQGVRRHLRPGGHPGHRRLREGLLRRARLHPRHVEARAGALQGLRGDAQVQPLPVAAHDGGGAAGQAARGADPHLRDARPGRAGRRRPLAVQGRRWARPAPTWRGSTASSTGSRRPKTRPSSCRT